MDLCCPLAAFGPSWGAPVGKIRIGLGSDIEATHWVTGHVYNLLIGVCRAENSRNRMEIRCVFMGVGKP